MYTHMKLYIFLPISMSAKLYVYLCFKHFSKRLRVEKRIEWKKNKRKIHQSTSSHLHDYTLNFFLWWKDGTYKTKHKPDW